MIDAIIERATINSDIILAVGWFSTIAMIVGVVNLSISYDRTSDGCYCCINSRELNAVSQSTYASRQLDDDSSSGISVYCGSCDRGGRLTKMWLNRFVFPCLVVPTTDCIVLRK